MRWDGRVPPQRLARRSNPPEGYLATANDDVPADPGAEAGLVAVNLSMGPYRVGRIRELLAAHLAAGAKLTPADMKVVQRDLTSAQAVLFLALIKAEASRFARGPLAGRLGLQIRRGVEGGGALRALHLAGRQTTFCPSWRFVTDLGADEAETVLAGGPSDRRFSRYYAIDVDRWLTYRYKRLIAKAP